MNKRSIFILGLAIGVLVTGGTVITLIFTPKTSYSVNLNDISFLALGDSYTIGESIPILGSWPYQLQGKAQDMGINITQLDLIAKTGWTSEDLLQNITGTYFNKTYDFIAILIGANDQFQGIPPEQYTENFIDILEFVSSLIHNSKNIIVISIPDYSVSPLICGRAKTIVRDEINALNYQNYKQASLFGTSYVDISDIVKDKENDQTMFAEDQLHFSSKMYTLWVNEILNAIQRLLE